MKFLITSSLLDGYDWLKSCPKSWKNKALDEFYSTIRREKRLVSKETQRGIEFEKLICDNCNKMTDGELKTFVYDYYKSVGVKDEIRLSNAAFVACCIAGRCKNGEQQVKLSKDICIDGEDYELFGYADILHKDRIVDIKTTKNYKEGYLYVKRSQHYIYSICSGITKFEYDVADFNESDSPWSFKSIEFEMNMEENFSIIESRIKDVVDYMKKSNLFDDYESVFSAKHED